MSDSVRPHRLQPIRLPHPWDSPGKNTEGIIIEKDTCTPVFTAALFKIAQTWKHPKRPLTEEWIDYVAHIFHGILLSH